MATRLITTLAAKRPYAARERLRDAFVRHAGWSGAVAREFGINRKTVYRLMVRLGLVEFVESIRARRIAANKERRNRIWSAYGNASQAAGNGRFPSRGKKDRRGA